MTRRPSALVPLDRALFALAPIGVVVFLVGYAISVALYPGGTLFDRHHVGYDLADNYLCDAFRARAYDGRANALGARVGQLGMLGLVLAASAALLGVPGTFRATSPRLAWVARVSAGIAALGMLAVPLTPAHEYGLLHFAAVGVAAIPSLLASYLGAIGLLGVLEDDRGLGGALRRLTGLTLLACTLHFAQYLAQVARLMGPSPSVPRAQKVVVAIVLAWITSVALWARSLPEASGRDADVDRPG